MTGQTQVQTILVTGASGFIGQALIPHLLDQGYQVIAASRSGEGDGLDDHPKLTRAATGDLRRDPDWYALLGGVDAVVHLAARVHQRVGSSDTDSENNLRVNYYATRALARAALAAGVKRFVFISSVQAQADVGSESPLTETDLLNPTDPYARTKFAAEEALDTLFRDQADQQLIILRPTLVYGPGVKANFRALMKAVAMGVPMPFGAVDNVRSFLFIGNLVDAITCSIAASGDASGTYLLKDGPDLSTAELIERIGVALERDVRLFSFPVVLLKILVGLIGQPGLSRRLLESLCVDDTAFRTRFDWTPPFSQEDGFRRTARAIGKKV